LVLILTMPSRLYGLLLALLLLPPPAAGQPVPDTAVVITELLYAPSPASNEFIELYNRSSAPVNLGRLAVADATRDFVPVAAADTLLPPGEHVVLARAPTAFRAAFPSVTPLTPDDWPALNNGGDTVLLRDTPRGTVIDSVPYAPDWGGADGRSLERIDPAGPSTLASNFGPSTAEAGATPGRRNALYAPDETAPRPVFAEQVAARTVEVTLSEPVRPASVSPAAFTLGSTAVTETHLRRDTVAVLSLAAPPSAAALRVDGLRDRVGNRRPTATVPLAYRPDSAALVINEILYAPRADAYDGRPDQVEYVELRNRTDRPLTLNGVRLTDRPDEAGRADTLRPGRKRALAPAGYGVIAAAPDGASADRSALAAAFPDAPLARDTVAYLPVDAARLGLQNEGDRVRLLRADGAPVAGVTYAPDWHAPGLEETRGTALERLSASGDPQSADNWTSSPAPAGGTPGRANAMGLAPPRTAPERTLRVAPSPFSLARDGATRIRYRLPAAPSLVRARIYDARGRKVRTLEDARLAGRTGELIWNGRDDAGNRVRVGVYVVLFEAVRAGAGTTTRLKAPVVVARPLN
jgi:hypothetical protein